jgi:transcription initiation factor TFIIIB Brf1 subunit/transcription initiation factor TFIIB
MDLDLIWNQVDSFKPVEDYKSSGSFYICLCGGVKDTHESDLPTCTTCGRCDDQFISDEPEWRGGIDEDGGVSDPSRVGAPVDERYSEMWSMGTIMSVRSNASYALKKLARIDFHTSMNHKDRSLFHSYADIEKASKDLPKCVIRDAEEMYRKFSTEKLTRGAVRTGIKANCLLQACKNNNVSRSIAEIAAAFGIPTKDISRTSDIFREVFPIVNEVTQVVMASDVASRLMNNFEIPDDIKRRVRMKVIRSCEQIQESTELSGKTPKTIAATVIRILVEEWVDVNKVCELCGVSSPTIKKIEVVVRGLLKNLKS